MIRDEPFRISCKCQAMKAAPIGGVKRIRHVRRFAPTLHPMRRLLPPDLDPTRGVIDHCDRATIRRNGRVHQCPLMYKRVAWLERTRIPQQHTALKLSKVGDGCKECKAVG